MSNTARQLDSREATYEDLLQVPEHLIAEIIDGQLYTQPRPAPKHARAASRLDRKLGGSYDTDGSEPGGWVILFEPELHLGAKPHILVPDLAGWRRERLPVLPETAWFELAPDWVCEIVSPATSARDRVHKMPIYAGQGVQYLWLIDPDAKTLEAYRLHEGQWLRSGAWAEEAVARVEPFDAIELELKTLWSI
jgi:Uma2 family endonuclease